MSATKTDNVNSSIIRYILMADPSPLIILRMHTWDTSVLLIYGLCWQLSSSYKINSYNN